MLLIINLSFADIFPQKQNSSSRSDSNNNTSDPLNQFTLKPSPPTSNGYPKKTSTSTTDNNASSSAQNSSFSAKNTPSSTNSYASGIGSLKPVQQSTAKKSSSSRVHFSKSNDAILNDGKKPEMKIPEILEVFTDLDRFIERELSEIAVRNRVGQRMAEIEQTSDVFTKLKDEYFKDKQEHQRDFEELVKQQERNDDKSFETIREEDEDPNESGNLSLLDLSIASRMNRLRAKKIEKLKLEMVKQEYLISKITRVIDHVRSVNDDNINDIITIERHYLVANTRFMSAMKEIRRLESPEPLHPRPFHRKGKCVLSDIILEVKQSYFERRQASRNEFIVVLLKYEDEVYASKAISITDDVRTLKFPSKFRVPEVFTDFNMQLEVYGTTFWRKQGALRDTMLKKYGFVTFTLADSGEKRSRFDMEEVIKGDVNPLRKKVLMTIDQKITPDVRYNGILLVKVGDDWYRTNAVLCGHLLEINLISEEDTETMLLDLHNFDSDFIVPVVSRVSKMPFAFLLKFDHYITGNDFS